MLRTTSRKRMLSVVALASSLALVAGCGSSDSDDSDSGEATEGYAGEIDVWGGKETPLVDNFNPFTPAPHHGTQGLIFEPLYVFNKSGDEDPTPMLATDYEFAEDGESMTIDVREGVKWNDGEDFTAEDVAFSFTFELAEPDYLESAEVVDDNTVELKFDGPRFGKIAQILQKDIIPEHVWGELGDDAEDTDDDGDLTFMNDEDPVGTGPYIVEKTSDAAYSFVPNEDYWQEGKPHLERVRYLGVDDNNSAEDMLNQGELDWASMFIPNYEAVIEDGYFGMVNSANDPTVVSTCANADLGCEGPQTDPAVREALSLAIDRSDIDEKAFAGIAEPLGASLMVPGRDDVWLPDSVEPTLPQEANIEEAQQVLEDAGYEEGSDGIYEKDGEPLELTLTSPDGWTDYNDTNTLIERQAEQAGIKVNASTVSQGEYDDARWAGEYELTLMGITGTQLADPFQLFDEWVSGDSTIEVGEALESGDFNFSRYANDDVDAAIDAANATEDEDEKREAYGTVIEALDEDIPYIPVVINTASTMTFYNQEDFEGWATDDDLYQFPASWGTHSAGVILSNVKAID